jgi:hypothetical protein
MPADMLTKAIGQTRVIELLRLLNMLDSSLSIKGHVEERTWFFMTILKSGSFFLSCLTHRSVDCLLSQTRFEPAS